VIAALGEDPVPISITGSAGSLNGTTITLAGDLQGTIEFTGN
jgi:hypothetical protein